VIELIEGNSTTKTERKKAQAEGKRLRLVRASLWDDVAVIGDQLWQQ